MDLGNPFQRGRGGPGGWWIVFEPELHLGGDILVPNLAGGAKEHMPERPGGAYIELAPDWVCEILSPSTMRLDRVLKLPTYAAAGVQHAWLMDPVAKTLEVYRLVPDSSQWLLVMCCGANETVRAEPFDAIELELPALWGEEPDGDQIPTPPHPEDTP